MQETGWNFNQKKKKLLQAWSYCCLSAAQDNNNKPFFPHRSVFYMHCGINFKVQVSSEWRLVDTCCLQQDEVMANAPRAE